MLYWISRNRNCEGRDGECCKQYEGLNSDWFSARVYFLPFYIVLSRTKWKCVTHSLSNHYKSQISLSLLIYSHKEETHCCLTKRNIVQSSEDVEYTEWTCILDVKLNNQIVRFQEYWSFGESGVPLHLHRSQVNSGSWSGRIYGSNRTKLCTNSKLNCLK